MIRDKGVDDRIAAAVNSSNSLCFGLCSGIRRFLPDRGNDHPDTYTG